MIRTVPFHKLLHTFRANMLANSSDHDLVAFIVHLEFLGATTPDPPNPFSLILGPQEPQRNRSDSDASVPLLVHPALFCGRCSEYPLDPLPLAASILLLLQLILMD
jgi:hypothetical protein